MHGFHRHGGHGRHERGDHDWAPRFFAMGMRGFGGGFGRGGFDRDDGDGFGGRGGFVGGRRGKRFAGEELRLMVLALLAEAPQHGYQLIRSFTEKSGEAYTPSPGVLYPLLTLLADMGLIEEVAGANEAGGGAKRSFALSEAGQAELAANRAAADAALERLAAMGEEAKRGDAGPVRRAMFNLRAAAIQRLLQGDKDRELALRIAELIDEVARKIERL